MPEKFSAIKGGLLEAIEKNYRNKDNDNKAKKEGGDKKNKDKKNDNKIKGGALLGSLNGSDNDYLLLPAGNPVERPFSMEAQDGGDKKRKSSKNKQRGGHGVGSGGIPAPVDAPLTILMDNGGNVSNDTQGSVDGVLQLGGKKSNKNNKKDKVVKGGSDASFGGNLAYAASTDSPMTILMPEASYAGGAKKRNSKKNQNGGTCGSAVSIYPPNDMMPAGANQYAKADMYTAGDVYAPVNEDKFSYTLSGASSATNVPTPYPAIQMGGKKNKSNKGGDKDKKQDQDNENKGGDKDKKQDQDKNKNKKKNNNKQNLIGGLAELTEALTNLTGGFKKP